jgi:hypothetical protein
MVMSSRTYERVRDHFEAHDGPGTYPKRDELTCNQCDASDRCQYAWDGYNTSGDCLGEK